MRNRNSEPNIMTNSKTSDIQTSVTEYSYTHDGVTITSLDKLTGEQVVELVAMRKRVHCDACEVGYHDTLEQKFACRGAQQRAVMQAMADQEASEPKRDGRFLSRNARPVTVPAMPKYLQVGATVQYVQGLDRTWSDAVVIERQSNGVVIRVDGRQVSIHASVIRKYLRQRPASSTTSSTKFCTYCQRSTPHQTTCGVSYCNVCQSKGAQ